MFPFNVEHALNMLAPFSIALHGFCMLLLFFNFEFLHGQFMHDCWIQGVYMMMVMMTMMMKDDDDDEGR